jgi:Recombination endonuclease VII
METKTCRGECGKTLPIDQFYKLRKDKPYRQSYCKTCFRLRGKAWEAAHPEHKEVDRAYAKRVRQADPEKFRLKDLKNDLKKKGTTLEEYQAKEQAQGGVCAICQKKNRSKRRLAVDHNHTTGVNRGLLCDLCNHALERLETIPGWINSAQQYLAKHATSAF